MNLYLEHENDKDFLLSNFDRRELRSIKTFVQYEEKLKSNCAELDFDYDPPSDEQWDYLRRQRLYCRWAHYKKKK